MSFLPTLPLIEMPEVTSSPWQEFSLTDFSGGLCTAFPESNIADNQFPALTNYYLQNDKSIKTRGPYHPYGADSSLDTVLTTAPKTFHWAQLGTTDALLASRISNSDSVVEWWNGSSWASVKTFSGSSTKKTQYVNFAINDQEDILFFNGRDTPQRWTGSSTSIDLGLTVPTDTVITAASATSGNAGGTGVGTSGTYYYKLTYFYESSDTTQYGESNPGATTTSATLTVTVGLRYAIELTGLPEPGEHTDLTSVSRVYIYRSQVNNESGIYHRVGYITSGTTFTDNTNESEEGVELPIEDGSVPAIKNAVVFRGRVWGVDGALPTKAVWTPPGQPDIFPALNYAYFPDELVGPKIFKENIYWFTTKQIYVTPNGDIDTYPYPLKICDRGTTSYESIVDVGNGLCFQGENNVYWVDFNTHSLKDGDYPIPIGEPIQDKIVNIPKTYRTNSAGCFYKDKYFLSYTGPNQTGNTATLVWNVEIGTRLLQKGLFGGWSSLDWAGNYLQNFEGELYSADNTNKYVMQHDASGAVDYYTEDGFAASSGQNITTELKTKVLHFGHEWAEKIFSSISLAIETSGVTYNVSLVLNKGIRASEYVRTKSFELGSTTLATDSNWLIWGQGTWDNFNWAISSYGFYAQHHKMGQGAKGKNAQVSIVSDNSQDTNLVLIKIFYKSLPAPN